ncbi:2-oxoacid:acceptor oxidoreductase family protein [Desulfosarcina sp.]|uniref:2-oxoacid:acceptor oxidoreductase family protein n=1 Tax=Desulfosarcina sp. TaxID=2027861 RepID=UPI0039709401
MKAFNIYLTGVGGQGIGLISEIILRAADHGGHFVKSVDTHGLAQRGGIVVSQIRLGENIFSPLIPAGQADLVIALERHEALRAAGTMLKDDGCLIYYNTVWQPLPVRLNEAAEVTETDIRSLCRPRGIQVWSVFQADLPDIRMQNVALLARVHGHRLIPGIDLSHYRAAMADLMSGSRLQMNLAVFAQGARPIPGS